MINTHKCRNYKYLLLYIIPINILFQLGISNIKFFNIIISIFYRVWKQIFLICTSIIFTQKMDL